MTGRFTDYPNFNTSFLGFFGIYWNKADSRFGDDYLFINTKITSWYTNCFENITQKFISVSKSVKFVTRWLFGIILQMNISGNHFKSVQQSSGKSTILMAIATPREALIPSFSTAFHFLLFRFLFGTAHNIGLFLQYFGLLYLPL